MLPFPLFNHTIFQGVREIPGVLYLAAQEGFTKVQNAQFPVSLFDQKISLKTLKRCINYTRVKPACSDQTFPRNRGFPDNEMIDCPVRILFFHLYSFLMGVNKGFVLLLKKKCFFTSFFLCLRNK